MDDARLFHVRLMWGKSETLVKAKKGSGQKFLVGEEVLALTGRPRGKSEALDYYNKAYYEYTEVREL